MPMKNRSSLIVLLLVALLPAFASSADDEKKQAEVEALKKYLPDSNASTPLPPRMSTFSITYLPVFLIVVALLIIIGLYVYDVFHDLNEEGGVYNWANDTISLHCSDTSTNQFKFLVGASMLFSIGLLILMYREWTYRNVTVYTIIWWACDVLAAVCFMCIGLFPTHGDSTRQKIGKTERSQEPEGQCLRCNATKVYRSVETKENLVLCNRTTCVSRHASKWIHLFTSLYAMIELTVSNMLYSWWFMESTDDHIVIFRVLSTFTLTTLVLLITIQGVIFMCTIPQKPKSVVYLCSMFSELFTLIFVVITTMCAILHRDPKVLWIFSTCVGYKT